MSTAKRHFRSDERGASAVELALLAGPLLLFVFGFIHMCLMMYTVTRLHWAAEDAARCASIRQECRVGGVSTGAADPTAIQNWASSRYAGLTPATFTYSSTDAVCPNKVTGAATYSISLPLFSHSFTLGSKACFT